MRLGKYQSYSSLMYRILLLSFLLDPTLRLSILSRQEGNVLPKHTNEHARISLTMICGLALKRLVDSILIVEKHEIYKSSAYPLFTNYHGGRYMVDVLSDFVNFFFINLVHIHFEIFKKQTTCLSYFKFLTDSVMSSLLF